MTSHKQADVTLLLEGTYPFVRGGVSGWVHDLITGLPEINFSLVHLGASRDQASTMRYALPDNVCNLHCHYLMDNYEEKRPSMREGDDAYFASSGQLHDWFRNPAASLDRTLLDTVLLQDQRCVGACVDDFFHSEAAWTEITKAYRQYCPTESFNAYFWSVRNMHGPLLKMTEISRNIPDSPIFHTLTTGYAGLLGAMLARRTGRPLILTEHGIYTKERKIDLQSAFFNMPRGRLAEGHHASNAHSHQIWIRLFEGIGRLVYDAADPIITLYEKNRQRQIHDGADPARTQVIGNGVDVARYAALRSKRPQDPPLVLGFIGRIVPIKDVKTFIRAVGVLAESLPAVEGWLAGPEEEDPDYVRECKELVESLGLQQRIRFLGFQKVDDILPKLGLLALSSISEAFPLVIGESCASGLPVIATDVGACRELIEGKDEEDRLLGPAGMVVPIANHERLASAAYALLTDKERWTAAQAAGIARVERYYPQCKVIERYRDVYRLTGEK